MATSFNWQTLTHFRNIGTETKAIVHSVTVLLLWLLLLLLMCRICVFLSTFAKLTVNKERCTRYNDTHAHMHGFVVIILLINAIYKVTANRSDAGRELCRRNVCPYLFHTNRFWQITKTTLFVYQSSHDIASPICCEISMNMIMVSTRLRITSLCVQQNRDFGLPIRTRRQRATTSSNRLISTQFQCK